MFSSCFQPPSLTNSAKTHKAPPCFFFHLLYWKLLLRALTTSLAAVEGSELHRVRREQ